MSVSKIIQNGWIIELHKSAKVKFNFSLSKNLIFCQTFRMRKLTVTLCLTIALLLGSMGMSWGYTVKGTGNTSCGELLEEEKKRSRGGILYFQNNAWIQGYITGRNYETNSSKGRGIKIESLYHALLKFCRDNPLKLFVHGTEFIYNSLLI